MSKELLLVAEALSNEKGVSKIVVLQAIQAALESATKKFSGKEIGVRVQLDQRTGDYETFQYWDIVADDQIAFADSQLGITLAKSKNPDIEIGQRIEEQMQSVDFGRIAA